MERVTFVNVHSVRSGLLVEVIGRTRGGEVAVSSYELELVDEADRTVRSLDDIPASEAPMLSEYVSEHGYQLIGTDEQTTQTGAARSGSAD